ncbi:hypothetical protein HHI36_024007 [Cryptolaemus montrouzieri]|uniref:C2H2-type domain-containing protein n=1 Tax=Cryptolaemus montrouzieri TaxID=559131 RepID=A0ABD2NZA4_9CUCU
MNLSHEEIEEPSKYSEEDDKTFVHQLIDNEGKSWDRNLFHETFNKSHSMQLKNEYESETKQHNDGKGVGESRSFTNKFIAEDRNIRNQGTKCENDDNLKIDISYKGIITGIKVESPGDENITNSPQGIDGEEKRCDSSEDCKIDIQYDKIITKSEVESSESSEDENISYKSEIDEDEGEFWDDVKSFEDSVKEEIVQEEVYRSENHVKSTQRKSEYCKSIHCYYQTTNKCTMEVHINSVHLGIKSYKCSLCEYQTATKSRLKDHINCKHLGIRNHKCTLCDFQTTQKSYLKHHMNSKHLGIRNHKCTLCDFQTATKSRLKDHINCKHLGIRNHKCSYCDYEAYEKNNLTKHINNVHLGIKITNVAIVSTGHQGGIKSKLIQMLYILVKKS